MADRSFTVVVERCGVVTLRDEPLSQPVRDGQFDVATVPAIPDRLIRRGRAADVRDVLVVAR